MILFILDAKLALITFLVFPLLAGASLWFRLVSAGAFRRTRETIGSITGYLQETLSGIRVVRSFGQEAFHEARFAELNEDNREANMVDGQAERHLLPGRGNALRRRDRRDRALRRLPGDRRPDHRRHGRGLHRHALEPVRPGPAALPAVHHLPVRDGGTGEDLPAAGRAPGPDRTARARVELPRINGEILFDDVTFAYARRRGSDESEPPALALDQVTLHVPPGQTVALVGATGAGKSTMAKLVARFYDPTAGRVLIDGHDLRDISSSSLRSQMGIVPQEAFLFSGTIGENIAFGRPQRHR